MTKVLMLAGDAAESLQVMYPYQPGTPTSPSRKLAERAPAKGAEQAVTA